MAELKTKPTNVSVEAFLNTVEDERKRADSFALLELFKEVTGEKPVMWGDAIVGFGQYHYKYASGQEGDWPITGFSPRKQSLTLYVYGILDSQPDLMARLGKYKTSKGCLYVKKLTDVDITVLKELISASVKFMKNAYP